MQLPSDMAAVTPAWLQQAVAEHPHFRGARIRALHAKPVGVGIGQVGDLARLAIDYDGSAGPSSVVVKLQTGFAPMRAVGIRYDMYLREAGFYRSLVAETRTPTPTVYFAGFDAAQERSALVMEDMSEWYWPDQLQGANAAQAERCVDALVQLAAGHWGADFSPYTWLPGSNSAVWDRIVGDYLACVPITCERLHRHITPEMERAVVRIGDQYEWIRARLAEPPIVLTHMDPRLENFVFADATATRLALIDWQLVTCMHPGWDLAYFLGTSLAEEDRRAWQEQLIARYLEGLAREGVRDYDPATCRRDFQLATMAMTTIAVIGGASFDESNARSAELFGAILRRSMTSVLDNDALALLPDRAN